MRKEKLLRKFYLDERNNVLFMTFIAFNIGTIILSHMIEFNSMFSIMVNILTIIGSLGISTFIGRINKIKLKQKEKLKDIPRINRINWLRVLKDLKGIVFLTGESGIGKTCLLHQLIEEFDKKNISYAYFDNNYLFGIKIGEITDKKYIILDQFERALSLKKISEIVQMIKRLRDKTIIISIRKEFIGDIYKLFNFSKSIKFLWLNIRESESEFVLKHLEIISRMDKDDIDKHNLYSKLLNDIKTNKISLIQLSCLEKEIQDMEEKYVEENLKRYNYDYDNAIKEYLKYQLDSYVYSDIAYMLLYLMCQDIKAQYVNERKDFQNVTLEQDGIIENAVHFLYEHEWIKKVKDNEQIRTGLTEHYEISHDYFIKQFEKLCLEQLDSNIRSNIKYYNVNCQDHRGTNEEGSWKTYVNNIYESFMNSDNKKHLNAGLYLLMAFIMLANIYILSFKLNNDHEYRMLAAINLVVGESIYYVYNYYFHFLSIFKIRYLPGIIIGFISCIMPFLFMDYWGISLGIEVCVVGIVMERISCRVREEEKQFFKTKFYIFCGIGLLIIIFGVFFQIYKNCKIFLVYPLFALYGIYMVMGIFNHINRNYVHSILGKILYGGKKM